MDEIFVQLAVILLTAFIFSYIAKSLKQPIIIGYIVAGIIISPFIISSGASTELVETFSKLGIAFLLFIVGLHLNPKVIKEIGTASLIVGLGQIILTFGIGFAVSFKLLGYGLMPSVYVGIALAFSSTIIIMKLLSDRQQLDSLYGKISIGVLIIQDLVAMGVLMFMSGISGDVSFADFALKSLLGGTILVVFLFLIGIFALPKITKSVAKSQELLFLFSICWCFLIASLFSFLGFSIEIGALIAGVILSLSPYSTEISAKIRPLRDFFLIIFFIILGFNVDIAGIGGVIIDALILSAIALILKPIILMLFMKYFGYTKRTNFLVGTTLGQISEFSLIVLVMGVSIGAVSTDILHTLILTMIITIILSTYGIIYSQKFYQATSRFLSVFEKKNIRKKREIKHTYDAILFGYNRIGFNILNSLKKVKQKYLVVDFNPDTIYDLQKLQVPSLYGDVDDPEFLGELPLNKMKLGVSTVPDFETNSLLIKEIRAVNSKAIIIVRAHTIKEAFDLYALGASYVLTPHFLGGEYVSKMIRDLKVNSKGYKEEKNKHIKMLEKMSEKGHDHPKVEKD
jgi:Kef-type K+ transport system membrane component KefB/Trk K+ transport system NAD-binding subunit